MPKYVLHVRLERVDEAIVDRYDKVTTPKTTTEMANIHLSSVNAEDIVAAAKGTLDIAIGVVRSDDV